MGAEKRLWEQDDTQTEKGHAGVFDSLSSIRRHSSSTKAGSTPGWGRVVFVQTTSKPALRSIQLQIQWVPGNLFSGYSSRNVRPVTYFRLVPKLINASSLISTHILSPRNREIRIFEHLAVIVPSDRSFPIILFTTNNRSRGVKQWKAKINFKKERESIFLCPN